MRPLLLLLLLLCAAAPARAQRAIYLVRHAEKADESRDPQLSAAGQARAAALAGLLRDAGVSAIYSSELRRTQQTAEPLARRLGLTPTILPAADPQGLVRRVREKNRADVVLIVAHSDTLPKLLQGFGYAREITIAHAEYDNLFVLVPQRDGPVTLLRLRLPSLPLADDR